MQLTVLLTVEVVNLLGETTTTTAVEVKQVEDFLAVSVAVQVVEIVEETIFFACVLEAWQPHVQSAFMHLQTGTIVVAGEAVTVQVESAAGKGSL